MLARCNRLKENKDFKGIFKKGKGLKEKFLFVKIKNNGMDLNRFGFIVSKKVSKKAVIRNKIKRRLREIIKARIAKMKQGYDIIILVYPEIKEKSFLEIENIVDKIFKKVKLL